MKLTSKRQNGRFCEVLATWLSHWRLIRFTWKSSFFGEVTQLMLVVFFFYRLFRTAYLSYIKGSSIPWGMPFLYSLTVGDRTDTLLRKVSKKNYQHKLRNFPAERRPQLQCGENLKSRRINLSSKLPPSDNFFIYANRRTYASFKAFTAVGSLICCCATVYFRSRRFETCIDLRTK